MSTTLLHASGQEVLDNIFAHNQRCTYSTGSRYLREAVSRQICTGSASHTAHIAPKRLAAGSICRRKCTWIRSCKNGGFGGGSNGPGRGGGGDGGGSGGGGSRRQPQPEAGTTVARTAIQQEVIILDVKGMHCGGCVLRVKRLLEGHSSVSQANVNLATEVALIRICLPPVAASSATENTRVAQMDGIAAELIQVLESNGFTAASRDTNQSQTAAAAIVKARQEERRRRMQEAGRRVAVAWALASVCLLGHLPHWWRGAPHALHRLASPHLHAVLSAVALIGPGRDIICMGWNAMRQQRPDMNSLVALGACASFAVSTVAMAMPSLGWPTFFEEPAMLLGCVLLGRSLEERAKLAASSDLAALQGLVPERARLEVGVTGMWREVPTEALAAGDILTVLPGDRIPVDGTVVGGASSADEAALTGEAMPVAKLPGSEVTAGTVNVEGKLRVRVERAGASTAMADILRLVETAQARTAPIQRIADSVAGRFSLGIMAASAATLAFWAFAGPRLFPQAVAAYYGNRGAGAAGSLLLSLQLACSVLTVACPCALGLAAPTAVLVATSAAARRGLLVRGGDVLEATSHVDTVIFDKTGTLTQGRPRVQSILPASPQLSGQQLLALAAALERESSHPLAAAITSAAEQAGAQQLVVDEGTCHQSPGSGICGRVDGISVALGTREWVCSQLEDEPRTAAERFLEASTSARAGCMQVCISVQGMLGGLLTLADELRPDAAATVEYLQRRGLQVHMLSGDTEQAALAVAGAVGIDPGNVHAGVKPSGKAELVAQLRQAGRCVAMVGDGINDAGALAAADVGLAMGSSVDAASEVASIVLLGDRLPQVLDALEISRATFRKIQQNLLWAFGYNLVGIPVAAGVLLPAYGLALTPSLSGAMMGVSSLAVMANSLLLQTQQPVILRRGAAKGMKDIPEHSHAHVVDTLTPEQEGERRNYLQRFGSKSLV